MALVRRFTGLPRRVVSPMTQYGAGGKDALCHQLLIPGIGIRKYRVDRTLQSRPWIEGESRRRRSCQSATDAREAQIESSSARERWPTWRLISVPMLHSRACVSRA